KGDAIVGLPKSFGRMSEVDLLGILPLPLVIVISGAVLIRFTLNSTLPGRYCYAIGSNIEAASSAGVTVPRYQILFSSILGALTGVAGVIESSRLVTGQPTAGEGYEL